MRGSEDVQEDPRSGRSAPADCGVGEGLGLLGDDLAVAPVVDGGAVHTGDFPCVLGSPTESTAHRRGKLIWLDFRGLSLHGPCSNRRGLLSLLSYTLQESANSR